MYALLFQADRTELRVFAIGRRARAKTVADFPIWK